MSVGVYGSIKPSDVSIEDISIHYNFTPNRETENNLIYPLTASDILSTTVLQDGVSDPDFIVGTENLLEGLYNMKLPASVFNQIGIYTIYIKPKRFSAVISDCGVLSSLPTVKGIVIDTKLNSFPTNLIANNALQGYRIEYLDSASGNKIRNLSRYVVTSNKSVPITQNVGNTNQSATRYRFDDAGSLLFLQLTPSSSSDVKPNALPFIGNPGQIILISNTYFSPLVIEIDMVENTIQTLSEYIMGEQLKDVQNGILTYFDKSRVITDQYNLFTVKDDITGDITEEVREKRTNIDTTQDINATLAAIQ